MDILYSDNSIAVCIKPAGVLSTDEPGGMPGLVRAALGGKNADVRTVHRLDRVVSGLMVLALSAPAASELSRQIRGDEFDKSYLAVVHGAPENERGRFTDLLMRDKAERKTYVAARPGKGVQEAVLDYRVIASADGASLVGIKLLTGRTHQIRCQFSSRAMPIIGDRKYGSDDGCDIALWSHELSFSHPETGERMHFKAYPPDAFPWDKFEYEK